MDYKIFWSDEAQDNLRGIISYLESEWSEKELISFKKKLSKQLDLIAKNPEDISSIGSTAKASEGCAEQTYDHFLWGK